MPIKCPEKRKEYHKEYNKKYYIKNKENIKEQAKKWQQENKEHRKEYEKKYYIKNKENIKENNKKWYQENKEHKSEYSKKWYQENIERIRENNKKWCQENKEHLKEYNKKRYEANPEPTALREIKIRYDLTKDDYIKMFEDQEGECLCCGVHLYNETILNNKKELEEKGIPHRILNVDHDHSYNLPGKKYSGNKESVRGMLCDYCNMNYDPLNIESDWYIFCEKKGKKRKEIVTQMRKMKDGSNFN